MAGVRATSIGVGATALHRRRVLQLAALGAAGATTFYVVPAAGRLRGGSPGMSIGTSFGDITLLGVRRTGAALLSGRPLRAGVWTDAVTVSMRIRNLTSPTQWLPAGQFQARLGDGRAVTAYRADPRSLTVRPRSAATVSVAFLVPQDGEVAHLEVTEPGALAPRLLGLPATGQPSVARAGMDAHEH